MMVHKLMLAAAGVAVSDEQDRVDVVFNNEGAKVIQRLTAEAFEAGTNARLVIKIGDELQAAVTVMEPLASKHVQISLDPQTNAEEAVARILGS